ncbi:hypothetical protein [Streptomyces sp. NBC_01768]|uniref:hypothetical protein n=1 Tax=Streptomyces sp. NBC_01768 TaxID=2975938 RepID=UPI002DD94B08|nr:hypothetical protein [Streptomyces sp. NBC_01768]WSC30189.1 hypothetical protein OG902_27800 [Streptomyces sp. NBC_01768]
MSERPGLDEAVTDLLVAVVAALDLPLPAVDAAAERAHSRLLDLRAMDVRIVLDVLSRSRHPGAVAESAAEIRRRTTREPVDYAPFVFREEGAA